MRCFRERIAVRILALTILAAVAGACAGGGDETAETPDRRVENEALGLAIEALPSGFTVTFNQGEALVLESVGTPGRVEASVGPPVGAVNLIEELKAHQAAIEALPNGAYRGQTELMAQLGRVYLSRGRFTGEDGTEQEEYRAMGIHPSGDRAFYLTYRYPASDDSAERGQAIVELVGELVGLPVDADTGIAD